MSGERLQTSTIDLADSISTIKLGPSENGPNLSPLCEELRKQSVLCFRPVHNIPVSSSTISREK